MRELKFALKHTFPIFLTYVFLGIAFGIMMTEVGYSPIVCAACALFIYAGSMQIIMVPMLAAGAPLITLAVMTLFVNGRHLFYGIGLIDRFRKMGWRYPYMVFGLTDETYSILCSVHIPEELNKYNTEFLITACNQSYWILGCFLGGCAGNFLPFDLTGIDFSATAFFLIVVLTQLKEFPSKIPSLVGLISGLCFLFVLGPGYFLIPSLSCALIALVIIRDFVQKDMNRHTSQKEVQS